MSVPFNLEFDTSLYKDGPVRHTTVANFPTSVEAAVAKYGEHAVLAGFVKSFVIAAQAKIRAEYKAPSTGSRTKRGSAISQIANARAAERLAAMRAAQAAAEAAVEEDPTDGIEDEIDTDLDEAIGE